jgi:uncharacterized protein (TIGR02145 family)
MKSQALSLLIVFLFPFIACKKKEVENLSTVKTLLVADIKSTSALSGAYVYLDGGEEISQKGIVWSTTPGPTIGNSNTNEGPGIGYFTSRLTGLIPYTTYYARAYAINAVGISYGEEKIFKTSNPNLNPNLTYNSIMDASGNSYATIVIGTQEWMAENLRTTVYANGDPIASPASDQFLGINSGAWTHYDNNIQYEFPYGKLYNWFAVNDPRNVCPTGWHVPSQQEYYTLINYLGGPTVAGGKLKSNNREFWESPNLNATNESGFSSLPGGYLGSDSNGASFNAEGNRGFWWSSTDGGFYGPYYIFMAYDSSMARSGDMGRNYGCCIRCLKD